MGLTLYKQDISPSVRSVYMVISALDVPDVKYIDVNVATGENLQESFVKINPQHSIPTLIDDDFILWDSHAIALYLIRKYAKDDSLYPSDLKMRATVDQRLHFDSSVLFIALRRAVRPIVFSGNPTVSPDALDEMKSAYNYTEKLLTSPWLAGDRVTVADICCVATISSMNIVLQIDSERYPKLASWFERCSELNFYKKGNEPGLKQCQSFLSKLL